MKGVMALSAGEKTVLATIIQRNSFVDDDGSQHKGIAPVAAQLAAVRADDGRTPVEPPPAGLS